MNQMVIFEIPGHLLKWATNFKSTNIIWQRIPQANTVYNSVPQNLLFFQSGRKHR